MPEGGFESLGPKVWGGMGCNGGAINRGDEKVPEIGDYSNLMAERCNRDRVGMRQPQSLLKTKIKCCQINRLFKCVEETSQPSLTLSLYEVYKCVFSEESIISKP